MNFHDLNLDEKVLDALDAMRFTECTPIQEKTIPLILEGRDVMGIAQTGTGKTAAYLLPIINRLYVGGRSEDAINCVVMSPTRELALQIDQAMEGFSYFVPVSSVAVYGGNDGLRYEQERKGLQLGADVIIATPGRLISHIQLENPDFSQVSFFVLDEADRMLDMGFYDDIIKIARLMPPTCQRIMFSATMPDDIRQLAAGLLRDPAQVRIAISKPVETVRQKACYCSEAQKTSVIRNLFKSQRPLERVIIFASSKRKVKELASMLKSLGMDVAEMHSDLEQAQREKTMTAFRNGHISALVATDIIARGIDIDDISMVINYDVPRNEEDYIHRIGRTARAGKGGEALTLVSARDRESFRRIEKFIGKSADSAPFGESAESAPSAAPGGRKGRGRHSSGRRQPPAAEAGRSPRGGRLRPFGKGGQGRQRRGGAGAPPPPPPQDV